MTKHISIIIFILSGLLYSQLRYDINKEEDKIFIYAEHGNYEGIKELIESGTDVNILDKDKISPIILASFNGHNDIVKLLIEYGADINIVNIFGYNAIMAAAANGHIDVFDTLLKNRLNFRQIFLFVCQYKL